MSEADQTAAAAQTVYEELIRSRDRIADLPPITALDVERATAAMHEVIWYFITPPRGAATELALPDHMKRGLAEAARDRGLDAYVLAIALVAQKLALRKVEAVNLAQQLDRIGGELDLLTHDFRVPKTALVETLRRLKVEIDARIAYLRTSRPAGYVFDETPEQYRDRPDKAEKPDQFFRRVYAAHVARGLTQADIRQADRGFYNSFHVWCSRHRKPISAFVPATRPRR